MDAADLYEGLELAGYPVAYGKFRSAPELPYIVYVFIEAADLMADNTNYHGVGDYHVELYTANKDPTAEAAVETQLKALGLPFGKLEAFVESEDMYQVLYEVRLI